MISNEKIIEFREGLDRTGYNGDVLFNEPLSGHATFGLGGPASVFLAPANTRDVRSAIRFANRRKMPWAILGGGSNVLFPDWGYDGCIIKFTEAMGDYDERNGYLHVEAGLGMSSLMRAAITNGFDGYDFLVGIPGTVGGALAMNAGTRDEWIDKLVLWVEVVDKKGDPARFKKTAGGYRESVIGSEYIITSAALKTDEADPSEIRRKMGARMRDRAAAQPLGERTAGSVFKNPPGESAWKLIDEAGLRGHVEGAAKFSEKHCNFISSGEGATSADVLALIELAQRRVFEEKGILLEREIVLIGFELPRPEVIAALEPEHPVEEESAAVDEEPAGDDTGADGAVPQESPGESAEEAAE